jgi:hypothetical protein
MGWVKYDQDPEQYGGMYKTLNSIFKTSERQFHALDSLYKTV